MENLIKSAKPLDGSLAEAYLNNRLNGRFSEIRHLVAPDCLWHLPSHWHAESRQSWPVMLASILKEGAPFDGTQSRLVGFARHRLIGLHRTYLDYHGGKAPVSPAKKIMGKLLGGYTPFGIPGKNLILAEGIETSLSLYVLFKVPVWAALSSTNMAHITLPPLPIAQTVYIAVDNDEAGRQAANKAAEKFWREGRKVVLMNPPDALNDFNDYLMTGAAFDQYRHHFH